MRGFYDRFSKDLENAAETIKTMKKTSIPTDEVCEKCGTGMVIKFGRFGQFLACGNYPECKNTREVGSKKSEGEAGANGENGEAEPVPPCELCGKEMALKKGRFGAFYGCTGYPECKNIKKMGRDGKGTTQEPVLSDEVCELCGKPMACRFCIMFCPTSWEWRRAPLLSRSGEAWKNRLILISY